MINKKQWLSRGVAALLAVAAAGCYSYKEPAAATFGDSYTQRKKDAAENLFNDITVLSLRDAQRIAIRNNPSYIAAFHSMEAARLKYLQAWGAYSPQITASFDLSGGTDWTIHATGLHSRQRHPRTESIRTQTGINASLLIFDGFARMFRLKAAKSGFDYQARMEEDACRTMMLAVSYAYNTVLLAKENRRIALEDKKFQESSLENTKHKFNAGAAPLSDVLNFEIYVKTAEVNLIDADYQYEVAIYALAQLMGYPDGTLPPHVKFPEGYSLEFAALPPVEIYLDAALANRPDLKAYREQLNIAKYQVYQSWGAYSPTITGNVGWNISTLDNNGYANGYHWDSNDTTGLSYGISASWTVFDGAIRFNQLREAQATQAIAEYQVASKWFEVISEVRTAYANYVQNVKKTDLFAKVRQLSAKQRDLVKEEYDAGKAELTRLNEAQRDLVEAETSLASSYINVQNAKAQLISVVGGTTAEYYLSEAGTGRYPGLDGVAVGEDGKITGEQTVPVSAPDLQRKPADPNAPEIKANPAEK